MTPVVNSVEEKSNEVPEIAELPLEAQETINELLAEDGERFSYRPLLARATGSITAALLLGRIIYWWHKKEKKPFFKFRDVCAHVRYRPGDSWLEEMSFTRYEFDAARKAISTKISAGMSKEQIMNQHYIGEGKERRINVAALVIYWTDKNRVTWYELNEKLLAKIVSFYRGKQKKAISEKQKYSISKKQKYSNAENQKRIKDHPLEETHPTEVDETKKGAPVRVTPPVETIPQEGLDRHVEEKESSSSAAPQFNLDTDLKHVIKVYEQNINLIVPAIISGNSDFIGMKDAIQEYTKAWVIEALELSAARGKRSWGYALGILGKWKANGKDNANGKHNQPTAGESHATQPQYKDGDCPTCKNIRFVRTASGSMTDCPDCRITAVRHE